MAEVDVELAPIGAVQRTRVGRTATEPLREDIRLLAGILGDTIREQDGDEVFGLVERARSESFRVGRSELDRAGLARMFDGMDIRQAIPLIRALTQFSLLANVAEDIHRERRRALHVHAGEPPQDSSLAATCRKLRAANLQSSTVAEALTDALVSPVMTAHPTETRRRTVFDAQRDITELMRLRLHGQTETPDGRDVEQELRRHVLTLWQTALVRPRRLRIRDEIEMGLQYYHAAFLQVVPKVNAEVRAMVKALWPDAQLLEPTSPTARLVDRRRSRRQSECDCRRGAFGHQQCRLHRPRSLFRRAGGARTRAVDVRAAGDHHRSSWRAGRRLRRPGTGRRAVPAGGAGGPCATHRDRVANPGPTSPSSSSTSPCRPTGHPPICWPIWTSSTRRCVPTAACCWPMIGWPGCGRRCARSVFTCAAWTCGRTRMCTKRSSPSCWPGPVCIPTTRRCPSQTASSCWSPSWPPAGR